MKNFIFAVLFAGSASFCGKFQAAEPPVTNDDGFKKEFSVQKQRLSPTGRNPYFILEPGYQLELENSGEKLVINVLTETKKIDDVETRVVEERETNDGKLVEISRNYFAIDSKDNAVYYFGEDSEMYTDGEVTKRDGWRSGEKQAHFGLAMPGKPVVGDKFYMEVAPGEAMDRAEITGIDESITTPAGTFKHCVRFAESTPLEKGEKEAKVFAPGVGLVLDDSLKLVKQNKIESKVEYKK